MTTPDVPASASAPPQEVPAPAKAAIARTGLLPLSAPMAYAGAFVSGLLYWLAFPGVDAWPLAFVAWVPLLVAIQGQTARRALLLGWVAGITMNVAGFWWLQGMLATFSGFPAPLCFLFLLIVCAYQGGRIALLGWLYGRATARGWPYAPVFAAAFAASELLYPLLFLWYFAATVHQVPLLTQVGDLGGPICVGLVLVAVEPRRSPRPSSRGSSAEGSSVPMLADRRGRRGARRASTARSASAWSTRRPRRRRPRPWAIVQANMGLMEKRSSVDEGLRRHLQLSADLRKQGADFVVWSETSAMRPVRDATYAEELRARRAAASACRRSSGRSSSSACPTSASTSSSTAPSRATPRGRSPAATTRSTCSRSASTCPSARRSPSSTGGRPTAAASRPGTSLDPLTLDVARREAPGHGAHLLRGHPPAIHQRRRQARGPGAPREPDQRRVVRRHRGAVGALRARAAARRRAPALPGARAPTAA